MKKRRVYRPRPRVAVGCLCCGNWIIGTPKAMQGRKYCSHACHSADQITIPEHRCIGCGVTYRPKASDRAGKYCSRECCFAHLAAKPKRVAYIVYRKTCMECGDGFSAERRNANLCSDGCRAARARRVSAERQVRDKQCKWCGKAYVVAHDQYLTDFCSSDCRKSQKRENARPHKHTRRARMRGASNIEAIRWEAVAREHLYMCACCGVDTPASLRGTTHDDAPEIDHVVALACGGDHVMGNLQLLCRKCNQDKGALSMDEFTSSRLAQLIDSNAGLVTTMRDYHFRGNKWRKRAA